MGDADYFEFELLQAPRQAEAHVNPDPKLLPIGAVVACVLALAIFPLIAIPALVVLWLLYGLSGRLIKSGSTPLRRVSRAVLPAAVLLLQPSGFELSRRLCLGPISLVARPTIRRLPI
jgi:hypothetical protein